MVAINEMPMLGGGTRKRVCTAMIRRYTPDSNQHSRAEEWSQAMKLKLYLPAVNGDVVANARGRPRG